MCTCGIDMATQHARPATHSSAVMAFGEMPSDPRAAVAAAPIWSRAWTDGLRRSVSTKGTIVTTQKTPTIM